MSNADRIYSCVIMTIIIISCGCSPVKVPLKGNYIENPTVFTSTKPVDSIWSNLTEIFITNGLGIKSIDRKKGIILTTKIPINSVYTFEDKDGQLLEPQAWVVLTKVFNKKKEWKPEDIYGEWNIQVFATEKGTTTVKIDPIVVCTYFPNTFTTMETRGQSTGKLEELLERIVNNN